MDGFEYMENIVLQINSSFKFIEFCDYIYAEEYSLAEKSDFIKKIDNYVIGNTHSSFLVKLEKGKILYRARKVEEKDYANIEKGVGVDKNGKFYGFNSENSKEAPLFVSGEGRNNIRGNSYLYVADNPQTACAEIKTNQNDLISVARFNVEKELRTVDFSNDVTFPEGSSKNEGIALGDFFTRIMLSYSIPVNQYNIIDYKITQFITDHIRKIGVDGICYRSGFSDGINYTIFNCHRSNIKFLDSKIYFHISEINSYLDVNEEKNVKTSNESKQFDVKRFKEALKRRIKAIDE